MDAAALTRKLRDLRRLERRFSGGASPVFDAFFSLEPGCPARYPFTMLLVFDDTSRARAVREFLHEVWGPAPRADAAGSLRAGGAGRSARARLLEALELPPDASAAQITQRFRVTAKELHPDLGGDHELMVELLALYDQADGGSDGA